MNKITKINTSYCNVKGERKNPSKFIFLSSTQSVVLHLWAHPSYFRLHMNSSSKALLGPLPAHKGILSPFYATTKPNKLLYIHLFSIWLPISLEVLQKQKLLMRRSIPTEVVIVGVLIIVMITKMIAKTYWVVICALNNLILLKLYEMGTVTIPIPQKKTTVVPKD